MLRPFFCLLLLLGTGLASAQQHSIGFGVHTGFTVPVTLDKGMDADPRYDSRYSLKGAPIGLAFMKDWVGFGILVTPGLITIGQNYNIVNTEGGHNGRRDITLKYFTVPLAFKLHLIDLDFFRVSALASISASYLYDASDLISHENVKLKFPGEIYPILPENYSVQYDGVIVPTLQRQVLSGSNEYNTIQMFAGLGLRSDWDVSNHWRVSIDFRVNYGLLESRNDAYLSEIADYQRLYDTPGGRKELFAQVTAGISRFIDFDKNDKDREKKLKGGRRKFVPSRQFKPRANTRPKNK